MSSKVTRTRRKSRKSNGGRNPSATRHLYAAAFEGLEDRRLFSLLGIAVDLPTTLALDTTPGSVTYSAGSQQFDDTATPVLFRLNSSTRVAVTPPKDFEFHIHVDNSGNLTGPSTPTDLLITGTVDLTASGGQVYTGTLLTGSIDQFGSDVSGNTGLYDARLTPTGGSLLPFFAGQDIGIFITSEVSTFDGTFTSDFIGETKALVGPIPLVAPSIVTAPGSTVAVGSGSKLTDSATLSGGFNETGNVTFSLYDPNNVLVDTETAAVNGDGTYSTPNGYLPLTAGTYQWVVSYGGDANNSAVASNAGSEPENATPASPAINTTPGGTIVLGSAAKLTDSAVLSGGVNETGTITFNLYDPTNSLVDTETATVSGNGTYTTPTGFLPTTAGTYQWVASYGGDNNNNSVASPKGSEPEIVSAASPAINTTPGATIVLGSATKLTDSAVLSGGVSETGLITFSLYSPANLVVDTETATVTGNGTYNTPTGYLPTTAGTYQWVASYSGDNNNNSVASPKGSEPEIVSPASPAINTTPGATIVLGSATKLTDSAVLSGGVSETGLITFSLYSPANLVVDTETATVTGNGTYNTPTGYLPTTAGTYQWVASYSGDNNNNSVASPKGSEPEIVSPASPAINTTPGATIVLGSATKLTDSAVLSGGVSETGLITFSLYSPANLVVDTETATVTGNGTYNTPTGYLPTTAGTYQWVASYSGDNNNNSVASPKGSEPEIVSPASPAINTTPGATIVLGSATKLTDSAVLSGGVSETGSITFTLYSPGNLVVDTETATVTGNGTYNTPTGYLPTTAGTYQWVASYSGDANNNSVASPKGSEPEIVSLASPAINTTPGATIVLGSATKLTDSAVLSGGVSETGSITFTLYSPSNLVVDTETATVTGNGTYNTPTGFLPTTAGTYQWVASYSGDNNNKSVASPKGSEPEIVTPASPAINTTPGATIVLGSATKLTDSAVLSGGVVETGSIIFSLYSPANVVVDTETVTVTGNATYNTPSGYLPTAAGTYQWVATYSGDANNNSVASPKGSEPEIVSPAAPAINTTPGPTITLGSGSKLTDSAVLSGGVSETGTITFNLYSPTNVVVDTETATVTGNGTYITPTGYLPTIAGTYQWVASYSGDANNKTVASPKGSEPECVNPQVTTISGTKYQDITGNGFSADDTPLGGVTINLYADSNNNGVFDPSAVSPDKIVATKTTGSNGNYAFTGIAPGLYFVTEVGPTGSTETGPVASPYYTIQVAAGGQYTGNNFDDFLQCTPNVKNVCYTINGGPPVTTLSGQTKQGATVTVNFTIPAGAPPDIYTLVSYNAPSATFVASQASQQTIYQIATGTFGPGVHSLTVKIPNNYYQIDFVSCPAIDHFGPAGSNIFYAAQGRLISADNGGLNTNVNNQTASMLFWANLGQTLIKNFNGGPTSTALGNWLASTMPNVYGSGSTKLGGLTNAQIAAQFMTYYNVSGQKNNAQVLATMLNIYASTTSLSGTAAVAYGFSVTSAGLGAAQFNIQTYGSLFGVANNTTLSITQILAGVNARSASGVLLSGNSSLLNLAYGFFSNVNGLGGIS